MSVEELRRENDHLKAEVQKLNEELAESNKNGNIAAEAGMSLLKANQENQEKYEEDTKIYQEQIEQLKQENFTLTTKISNYNHTHQAYLDELDTMKTQLETSFRQRMHHMEQSHSLKVQELKRESDELRGEIERLENVIEKEREKSKTQECHIKTLKEEIDNQLSATIMNGEITELQSHCHKLEERNKYLNDEIIEKRMELEVITHQYEDLTFKIKDIENIMKDKEKLALEWYQTLQETQDENLLLQNQIEQQRVKQLENDWQGQGNSLFGEVEDKRLELERKLISLQVRFETLDRTHSILKQQYRKLKVEMSALLCRHGTVSADAAHVQRLQRTLRQRESDLHSMTDKINKLEKQRGVVINSENTSQFADAFLKFGDKKEYIHYLEQQLRNMECTVSGLREDLDLKTTQLLWESSKLTDTEAKLHKCEQDKSRLINEVCKIKIKLQETRDKENEVKANLKATEKEISTLRQQLKYKINKGIKFTEESEPKIMTRNDKIEKVNKEIKKEVPIKKSINLLEELERGACQDDSISPCGLVVDNGTSEIDNNDEQDLIKKEVLPPSDNIENNTTMNTSTTVHKKKTIKRQENSEKIEQCQQQ